MIGKHIGQLAIESIKYIFNIDHCICYEAIATLAIFISLTKLYFNRITFALHDRLLMIKETLLTIKDRLNPGKTSADATTKFQRG